MLIRMSKVFFGKILVWGLSFSNGPDIIPNKGMKGLGRKGTEPETSSTEQDHVRN
jgi:hypothetical protein